MGMIGKILAARLGMKMMDRALHKQEQQYAQAEPTTGEYIPANQVLTTGSRIKAGAGAVVDRAAQVYKQNPKLIGGLGLLALAAMLVKVKQGQRMF